jgi:drug/metabolite transporter (DMT)-like permease
MSNNNALTLNLPLGITITIIAYLFFATGGAFVKALNNNIPTIQIVFVQNMVSLFCLLPFLFVKGAHNFRTKYFPLHLVRDIAVLLNYLFYFIAIKHVNLIDATVLIYTSPFFIPLIILLLMKEKVNNNVWWTIIIGFIGIALILKPGPRIINPYSIYGILSGVAGAISLVSIRMLNRKQEHLFRTSFYGFFVGASLTAGFAIFYWTMPTTAQWLLLLGVGFTIGIGQILLIIAYRYGTASFLSPLCYSNIVFTFIISWLIFHIVPGWLSFFGTLLIIFGGSLSLIFRLKRKKLKKVFTVPPKNKI